MPYKLFIDTNVYLDFLMQRGDDWRDAEAIFRLAEDGILQIFTSASSLLNLMYVMQTCKLSKKEIIEHATAILTHSKLINPDNITFEIALSSVFKDLEDAVQYYTALEVNGINYFITSNIKDYKNTSTLLPVLTPSEFMIEYSRE